MPVAFQSHLSPPPPHLRKSLPAQGTAVDAGIAVTEDPASQGSYQRIDIILGDRAGRESRPLQPSHGTHRQALGQHPSADLYHQQGLPVWRRRMSLRELMQVRKLHRLLLAER